MGTSIAILGGGIGGLAAAAFLQQRGAEVTVFEQAPQLTEVGAGLILAPNAIRLLRRLGVLDRLAPGLVKLDYGWEFRRWEDGRILSVEDLTDRCRELYGEHTYGAHRADLLAAIQSAVRPDSIRLGKRAVEMTHEPSGAVTLAFDDGGAFTADVLIGADGVHSLVRQRLVGPSPGQYSGMSAFRALVPAERAPEFALRPAQTLWLGPGHHLVHYPVAGGRFVNLVAFAPAGEFRRESWTTTVELAEFQAEFAGWDPRLEQLIAQAHRPGRWALLDRSPLQRWAHGTVALLGDAAHPMFPFFAQGAAQAIEDAAVVAEELTTQPDPATALANYQDRRIERATAIQRASHDRKHINHLPDGPEQQQRDQQLRQGDPLLKSGWIYGYDPLAAARA